MPQFDQLASTEFDPTPEIPSASSLRDRVALIEGPSEHDVEQLLPFGQRLQMICSMLLIGFAVFCVRSYFVEDAFHRLRWLWAFAFAVFGASEVLLAFWKPLTRRRLLIVEGLIFGGAAVFFAALMHLSVVRNVAMNPPWEKWVVFSVAIGMAWFCALAFGYAMISVESGRLAAITVTLLLATPAAVVTYEWYQSSIFDEIVDNTMLIQIAFTLLLCWGAIIYWVRRLDLLKREARRAVRFGQYRLKQLIGRGGMGEVYLAEHTLLKRPCALKRIRESHDADPTMLARFEREVRATAELTHPHTVDIYDYGRANDGTFYYVMELLWGLTLEDLVQRHGRLPAARAVHLLRQVCDALEEAHVAGLMHRDIKPSNIYAARRGGEYDFVKLLDFGLVKPVARPGEPALSRAETVIGSPLYMAPEQIMNQHNADARADIYSLGAVAYFLLVGRPPFLAASALEILVAHARDAVRPPSQLIPEVPADVEAIVLKCLSKEPADRFASSAALGEALAACSVAEQWTRHDAARWWDERKFGVPGQRSEARPSEGDPDATGPFALQSP
jgi:eukaryotic-like serine/threonine-protein kinase